MSLENLTEKKFPLADSIHHGYLHFEALTDHDYSFNCVRCGDHPPVVVMDLHKKAVFNMSGEHFVFLSLSLPTFSTFPFLICLKCVICSIVASDLKMPPMGHKGDVNAEDFWDCVGKQEIARGFLSSK